MSDYKGEWQAAKTKFEESSGVKKPAPTKKNLFGKAVRQKVGIGEAFGKVDKLMPEDDGETMRQKDLEKLGPLVSAAGQEVRDYIKLLTDSIDNEKEEHGKGAETIYRDLKILKAELESMTAHMKAKLDRIYAVRRAESEGLNQRLKMFLTSFRVMKTAIDRNGKKALLVVQQLLKDPTPQNFNAAFPTAARDLTQNVAQIRKFTLPEELSPEQLQFRGEALEDPRIAEAVIEFDKKVAHFKHETIPLMREEGTTPMDSTLAKYCNNPIRFEEGASREDVIEATKNFGRQVKKALELGQRMI